MIRNRKLLGSMLAIAFLTASPAAMFAQQKPAEVPPTFQREKIPMGPEIQIGSMDDSFVYVASEMSFDGKLVKGAPYSAQAVTEMTQMLIDGNRIVKKSVASIYRDSEGRTRRDQALKAIGPFAATGGEAPQTIFISDPVAGVHYVLDGRTRTARKMPAFRFEWKTPMAPPPGSTRVMVQPEGPGPEGAVKMRTEGTFTVTAPPHSGDTGVVMQYRTDSRKRGKSEPLGKQLVEGVEAEGTRYTITIPAGEIGNDRPIEIVDERWYSPELQTMIMTKHSDPRSGETVYRLTNISRGEQPRSLFEVPGDYTIKPSSVGYGSGVGNSAGHGGGTGVGAGSGSGSGAGGGVTVATTVPPSASGIRPIRGGVLNGKATSLPAPEYPAIARAAGASGSVTVQITIDEDGNVISAEADSGHPLLRAAAVTAAREAKFSPTKLSGQAVKVQGVVVYNFSPE